MRKGHSCCGDGAAEDRNEAIPLSYGGPNIPQQGNYVYVVSAISVNRVLGSMVAPGAAINIASETMSAMGMVSMSKSS